MKALGLVLVAAALASASAVVRLRNDTFDHYIETHPLVLAQFCMPWYERCQTLFTEFETAAEVLKEKNISLVDVDCEEQGKLCNSFNISSYPALRIFRGSKNIARYREKRTAKSIISYMIRQTLPPVSVVDSTNFEELKSLDLPLLVAFIEEDDQSVQDLFASLTETHQNEVLFGTTSDISLANEDAIIAPFAVLYNPLDDVPAVLMAPLNTKSIEPFLAQASTPLIGKFSIATFYDYTESGIPLAFIFASTQSERGALARTLKPIAEKYRGALNFATINAVEFAFFAEPLGLVPGKFPAFVIQDVVSGDTAPLHQNAEITADAVRKFVDQYLEGKKLAGNENEDIQHSEL